MLHDKCSMYVERPGFVEHELMAASLEKYGVSRELKMGDLEQGSFFGLLDDLLGLHRRSQQEGVERPSFVTTDGVQVFAEVACGVRSFSSLPAIVP